MSLKQEALIHSVYKHWRYANLKHKFINQVTKRPVGLTINMPTEMLPEDYTAHICIFVHYLYTKLHSHESGPKPPIFLLSRKYLYAIIYY